MKWENASLLYVAVDVETGSRIPGRCQAPLLSVCVGVLTVDVRRPLDAGRVESGTWFGCRYQPPTSTCR